jgi:hypothetical protein
MDIVLPSGLMVGRYRLELRSGRAVTLPDYPGSMLRGAFGQAFKRTVCVVSHGNCGRCIMAEKCHYPYVFETPFPRDYPARGQQQAPHPFLLGLERAAYRSELAPDEPLHFGLTLFGKANDALKYVVEAVSDMARAGLGFGRAPFRLRDVAVQGANQKFHSILDSEKGRLVKESPGPMPLGDAVGEMSGRLREARRLRVTFRTPARIRVHGDLQAEMNFELLVRNVLRRVAMLTEIHGGSPCGFDFKGIVEASKPIRTESSSLRWLDWERWSNRQGGKMKLGGFLGEIEFAGEGIGDFAPLLAAGELLNVGTGSSFGLGKFEVEPVGERNVGL